ncbi:MAG: hypothetical protein JSR82_17795 [Verrucomicrobia bacterium]|nr:hypothetical protein [Verrucomicrobiota bacterium]
MPSASHSQLLAGLALGILAASLPAQTIRTWNGTNATWQNSASWVGGNIPGATEVASFTAAPTAGPNPAHPVFANTSDVTVRGIVFAHDATGGVYDLQGNGRNLTLATGTGQVQRAAWTVRGWNPVRREPGRFSFLPFPPDAIPFTVQAVSLLRIGTLANPTPGTGLDLGHNAAFGIANAVVDLTSEAFVNHGGTLHVSRVNGGTATFAAASVRIEGGYNLLTFDGPAATGVNATFAVTTGPLRIASGVAVVQVLPRGGNVTAQFGRLELQDGAGAVRFDLRSDGPRSASAVFTLAPALTDGVIASAVRSPNLGWAIVSTPQADGVPGDFFAGYAGGVVAVAPQAVGDPNNSPGPVLANPAIATSAHLDLVGHANVADGTTLQIDTLRLSAPGGTLQLGSGAQLNCVAFLLPNYQPTSGGGAMRIEGGAITGGATRYFHIEHPADGRSGPPLHLQLASDLALPPDGFPSPFGLVKSGRGFLELVGDSDQVNLGQAGSAITLSAGTLRARVTSGPVLLQNFGSNNLLQFRGGVLEADSSGAPFDPVLQVQRSDFNRSLGEGLGQVNWSRINVNGDGGGSGGFGAAGGALQVNLAVGNVPGATLQWDFTPGFLKDGHALVTGSVRQSPNSPVLWLNPIALDSGTASTLARVREFEVLGTHYFVGGTSLVFEPSVLRVQAPIGGSSSTDLLKTGYGRLELTVPNTYAGQTIVRGGTLRAAPRQVGDAVLVFTSRIVVHGAPSIAPSGERLADGSRLELAAGRQIADPTPLVLADGGTFATGGFDETLGTLTVADASGTLGVTNSAKAVLDLRSLDGTSPHASKLRFANSAALTWTGGLEVWNWTGSTQGGGGDQVLFGSDSTGLTGAQVNVIDFYSDGGLTYLGRARLLPTGEIVPDVVTPSLAVEPQSGNTLKITWANTPAGFVLERCDSLESGGIWTPDPNPPVANGTNFEVVEPIDASRRFFRLRR